MRRAQTRHDDLDRGMPSSHTSTEGHFALVNPCGSFASVGLAGVMARTRPFSLRVRRSALAH